MTHSYIYVLADPREPDHYRYCGHSSNLRGRLNNHYNLDRRLHPNSKKTLWLNKLEAEGVRALIIELDRVPNGGKWTAEVEMIAKLKAAGHRLTNGTSGKSKQDRYQATPAELRALLKYDPETGALYWKECHDQGLFKSSRAYKHHLNKVGKRADQPDGSYRVLSVFRTKLLAHRVAFALMTGKWPTYLVDHQDGNSLNNQYSNLRQVTSVENSLNRSRPRNNTSGQVGVTWKRKLCKYKAYINMNGSLRKHLGYFDTLEKAVAARKTAEADLGFHPNHGRKKP